MAKIIIEAVRRDEMRPPYNKGDGASGDWYYGEAGDLHIKVTGVDPLRHKEALCVAIHELVEAALCCHADISQETVDEFDAKFEGDGEPGDDPFCPYREQHRKACLLEFILADYLGLDDYGEMR